MSNCYSYPWQCREIAVKNALSAAAKARLHRVQRSPIEYKAGECSATQVGRCIYKYSIRSSNPIFFNDLLHLLCEGGFFLLGVGLLLLLGFLLVWFCWVFLFGLLGWFVWFFFQDYHTDIVEMFTRRSKLHLSGTRNM